MSSCRLDCSAEEKKLAECVRDILNAHLVRRATAFISPKRTIKATAQRRADKRSKSATVLVTVGKPNSIERRFIKACQKAGMCFPLNQIIWKPWPKKKPKKRVRLPRLKVSAMRPISAQATTIGSTLVSKPLSGPYPPITA